MACACGQQCSHPQPKSTFLVQTGDESRRSSANLRGKVNDSFRQPRPVVSLNTAAAAEWLQDSRPATRESPTNLPPDNALGRRAAARCLRHEGGDDLYPVRSRRFTNHRAASESMLVEQGRVATHPTVGRERDEYSLAA